MKKNCLLLLCCSILLTSVQKVTCFDLSAHLRTIVENMRSEMTNGFPDLMIPRLEPFMLSDVDREIKEQNVDLYLTLRNLKVDGLSKFQILNLVTDMKAMKLESSLLLPILEIDGIYGLKGTVFRHLPVFGDDQIELKLVNFQVDLTAEFSNIDGKLQIIHLSSKIKVKEIPMYLHNLFGEGPLGKTVMAVFRNIGLALFNAYRDRIENDFNMIAKSTLNKELEKLDAFNVEEQPVLYNSKQSSSFKPNVNSIVDDVLEDVLKEQGDNFDPMPLNEYKTGFSQRILLLTLSCEAKLYNGYVLGIKTLHRTGDFYLDSLPLNKKALNGYVGFNNLNAGYSIKLEALGVGIELPMTANVESANVKLEVVYDKATNVSKITKYELTLGKVRVHLKNLGPFSWVADPMTSFIINIMRPMLAWIIQTPVKVAVEEAFNKIIPLNPYL